MKKTLILGLAAMLTLSLGACGPKQLDETQKLRSTTGARDAADRSNADFVQCSGQDSDKDGYVTCTVKDRGGAKMEHELLCAYDSVGCKRKS